MIPQDDDSEERLKLAQQNLALQKQQFEEQKRSNLESERLQKMREQGDAARAALDEERAQKEARAKVMADRAAWMEKFGQMANSGDMEGLYSMAPQGQALGVGVELQDIQNGMPRFRLDPDPEATAARQKAQESVWGQAQGDEMDRAGIGYKGTELDAELAVGADPAQTEERYKEAVAHYGAQRAPGPEKPLDPSVRAAVGLPEETPPAGELGVAPLPEEPAPPLIPARGPDQPDLMGAVPSNVIDMPARHASLLNRLDPVLSSLADSYPLDRPNAEGRGAQQASADSTKQALLASGLSLPKALDAFSGLRTGVDTGFNTIRQADAQKDRAQLDAERRAEERAEDAQRRAAERAENRTAVSVQDEENFKLRGREAALKTVTERKASEAVARIPTVNRIIAIMLDDDPNNDKSEGGWLARAGGESGTITREDINTALGKDALNFWQKLQAGFEEQAIGGLSKAQRQSIVNRMRSRLAQDKDLMLSVADAVEESASAPETNKFHAIGMRDQLKLSLPADVRKEWEARRKKTQPAAPAAAAGGAAAPAPGDDSLGKAPLPQQLGEVENALGSWLGDMKHPAIKVLAENFPGAKGGSVDEAVGEYIASLEADHPEAYAAAKRGDSEGFKRAMAGGGSKPPPAARTPEEQKLLDAIEKAKRR